MQVRNTFDRNVVLMTAALTVSFMIRNTSPISWPLLILLKIVKDGAFLPILISGFVVFLPLICAFTLIDSLYFGMQHFPVITALNFFNVNLGEGLSNYFGTDPWYMYITGVFPLYFTASLPFVFLGIYSYGKDKLSVAKDGQPPYLLMISGCYIFVYSAISHKEPRFILPALPFIFMMMGYYTAKQVRDTNFKYKKLMTALIVIYGVVELLLGTWYLTCRSRHWEAFTYLQTKPGAPHSIYALSIDAPYYTLTHRQKYLDDDNKEINRTKFIKLHRDPTFVRAKHGEPYPVLENYDYNRCFEMLDMIN